MGKKIKQEKENKQINTWIGKTKGTGKVNTGK